MMPAARSYHPGGINVLFVDGSVHSMSETMESSIWTALGSMNGGEVISANDY